MAAIQDPKTLRQLYIPKTQDDRLRAIAREREVAVNVLVREAIELFLKEAKK